MEVAGRGILKRASRPCPLVRPSLPVLLCAILLVGCQTNALRDRHTLAVPQTRHLALLPAHDFPCTSPADLAQAQGYCAAAARQEESQIEGCVDLYFQAAIHAWRHLESAPAGPACDPDYQAAWQTYQRSLGRLIAAAGRYGRLDPRGRLMIADGSRRRPVPIEYHGFAWQPCEFCQVLPARDFHDSDLQRYYQTCGLGVSLIAVRHACGQEPYYRPKQPFAVTAILRPLCRDDQRADGVRAASDSRRRDAVLTFYNPCLIDALDVGSARVRMERDLSAPFAYLLREAPRRFTEGFVNPGDADVKPALLMMEPYQRGKIPVVFIHGLWSDPMTWVDTVNELRAQGDLYRQYQFWYFQYPTGGELLESAAKLREKLRLAREQFDPQHQDQAMEDMVLVGHSMGGLVAQLQITHSYDILWRHAANQPLEAVRTVPKMREQLRRVFFFDPSPLVRRVVFIATPHRGSGMSRRLVGRFASSLVRYSEGDTAEYRQLMDNNRNIFKEYLWESRPTTVDLLEPSNPMLLAMAQMPFDGCVQMHSIIGASQRTLAGEWSDGVVPVSSARQAGVRSELFVPARHDKLHRDPACVAELMRIMRQHDQQRTSTVARYGR
jgi:pimeloyl-ACP methyl ester carboxylesterase